VNRCVACATTFNGGWTCPACGFTPREEEGILWFAPEAAAAGGGFDPAAFSHLAALEADSFWFRARNRIIGWALREYFPQARRVLEVGCGTGFVLESLRISRPELTLAGAELYAEGLRVARERVPDAAFYQLDATRIPFDGAWDVVCAFDVLEHVPDDEAFLRGMRAASRPGGGIVVTVPQHPSLWSAADDYAHHERRYRRAELVHKVTRAGFRVTRVTSFVTLLLPAMYVSRFLSRGSTRYDPTQEHRAARRLPFLERLLDAERWAISRGVSFPAGGSLLLVAHRS
jgi:SAM-dependent methyltransferase